MTHSADYLSDITLASSNVLLGLKQKMKQETNAKERTSSYTHTARSLFIFLTCRRVFVIESDKRAFCGL